MGRANRIHVRIAVICLLFVAAAHAEAPKVSPRALPSDLRLGPLKDLNGYFPFIPCKSKEAWAVRAERIRRQLLVATGLWPMPAPTPPHAAVYGRVDRDGYTVEKVCLESFPGHFVTGNLYRPKGRSGRLPAVLSPHGHWANGRFYDAGEKELHKSIAQGAERFDPSGRYPLQARCVQLARMGCIVFHYDMVGYADSVQLGHYMGIRPAMNTLENWGYYSPQAEARLQTIMGLQTYNSIRALDWLAGRDDVDPQRIGVTGASGGGTQTFILVAIDPRPAAVFPAVMVSTAMQGGCTCENASYLRIGTGNVEIAALIAPRPLGMTAADDWTKEIATKGLPELKAHYAMLGVADRVMANPLLQFPHNYNYASRAVMYAFFNEHLKLGLSGPIVEGDFKPLSVREMSVWDAAHPKPPSGDDYERSLLRWITAQSDRQLGDLVPKDGASLARYREVVGGAVDILIGRGLPAPGAIVVKQRQDTDRGTFRLSNMLLRHAAEGEELPAIVLKPKSWNKQLVIWISKEGKRSLLDGQGKPREPVGRLLAAGMAVVGVDLLGQGDFSIDGKPWAKARLNKSGRGAWTAYAGYTFGYNYPLFAQRVHDVLSVVSFGRNTLGAAKVHLVGLDGAGHWVLAARAQARETVDRAAADTAGFCFAQLTAIDDPDFLPGGAKYLDLPGIAALSAPLPLWLAGETPAALPVVSAAYEAAQAPLNLVRNSGGASPQETSALEWLLRCTVGDVPLLCEVAAKSRRPAEAPQLSSVCFSSRWIHPLTPQDPWNTFQAAAAFHATDHLWVYTVDRHAVDRLKLSGGKVYLAINSRWQFPYDMFEMGTAELPERDVNPKTIYERFADARRHGKAQVFTVVPKAIDETEVAPTRRAIATCYACGGHLLAPWDVYTLSDHPRYYGKPEQYADLYKFVREHSQQIDGYEEAAFLLQGLTDARHPAEQPISLANADDVAAIARAVPGKPGAPVVIHLVDWRAAPQPFTVKLLTCRFVRHGSLQAELLRPGSPATRLECHTTDTHTSMEIPRLNPWGIVVLTPSREE